MQTFNMLLSTAFMKYRLELDLLCIGIVLVALHYGRLQKHRKHWTGCWFQILGQKCKSVHLCTSTIKKISKTA